MDVLPGEVIFQILTYMEVSDLHRFSCVGRWTHNFCQDEGLWKLRVIKKYDVRSLPSSTSTWKDCYALLGKMMNVPVLIQNDYLTETMKSGLTATISFFTIVQDLIPHNNHPCPYVITTNKTVYFISSRDIWRRAYIEGIEKILFFKEEERQPHVSCRDRIDHIQFSLAHPVGTNKYVTFGPQRTFIGLALRLVGGVLKTTTYFKISIPLLGIMVMMGWEKSLYFQPEAILNRTLFHLLQAKGIKTNDQGIYPLLEVIISETTEGRSSPSESFSPPGA